MIRVSKAEFWQQIKMAYFYKRIEQWCKFLVLMMSHDFSMNETNCASALKWVSQNEWAMWSRDVHVLRWKIVNIGASFDRWKFYVLLTTVTNWQTELDPTEPWLEFESKNGGVFRVWYSLCESFIEKIKYYRNFDPAMIKGLTGQQMKKDACVKHLKTDQHCRAVVLHKAPTSEEIYPTRMRVRELADSWI